MATSRAINSAAILRLVDSILPVNGNPMIPVQANFQAAVSGSITEAGVKTRSRASFPLQGHSAAVFKLHTHLSWGFNKCAANGS